MALTLVAIRLNYQYTIMQAKRLEEAAERMRKIASHDINESIDSIRASWTGDNANAFIMKEEQLRVKVEKTANSMMNTAQTIRRIAQNIYEAEMRNYRLIKG